MLDLASHLKKQSSERLGTAKLNDAVKTIFQEREPVNAGGRRVKVYYVTQVDIAPPTIVLFVNHPEDVSEAYQRFVINRFRDLLPYGEVPIKLVIRGRTERGGGVDGRRSAGAPAARPSGTPHQGSATTESGTRSQPG